MSPPMASMAWKILTALPLFDVGMAAFLSFCKRSGVMRSDDDAAAVPETMTLDAYAPPESASVPSLPGLVSAPAFVFCSLKVKV